MKINYNSTSSKLWRWFYRNCEMPNNLCSYFWSYVALCILIVPCLIFRSWAFLPFVYEEREERGIQFIKAIACWVALTASFWLIAPVVRFLFLHKNDWLKQEGIVLCVILLISIAVVIIVGIFWYFENRDSNIFTDNIIVEFVKAKKNRYCPLLEINFDEEFAVKKNDFWNSQYYIISKTDKEYLKFNYSESRYVKTKEERDACAVRSIDDAIEKIKLYRSALTNE